MSFVNPLLQVLAKAQKIVSSMEKSSQVKEKLLKKQFIFEDMEGKSKSFVTYVLTHCWSTYYILEQLLEVEPPR